MSKVARLPVMTAYIIFDEQIMRSEIANSWHLILVDNECT